MTGSAKNFFLNRLSPRYHRGQLCGNISLCSLYSPFRTANRVTAIKIHFTMFRVKRMSFICKKYLKNTNTNLLQKIGEKHTHPNGIKKNNHLEIIMITFQCIFFIYLPFYVGIIILQIELQVSLFSLIVVGNF